MTKPPQCVSELPMSERALIALREAVRKVIEDRARRGLGVHIERAGRIVEVPAAELLEELASHST